MRSRPGNTGKGVSLARGVVLVFGYGITSSILGLAVAVATIHALYPGVAEWRRTCGDCRPESGRDRRVLVGYASQPPACGRPDPKGGNGGVPRGRGIRGETPSVRARPGARWGGVHPDRHCSRVRDRVLYRSWYALG